MGGGGGGGGESAAPEAFESAPVASADGALKCRLTGLNRPRCSKRKEKIKFKYADVTSSPIFERYTSHWRQRALDEPFSLYVTSDSTTNDSSRAKTVKRTNLLLLLHLLVIKLLLLLLLLLLSILILGVKLLLLLLHL